MGKLLLALVVVVVVGAEVAAPPFVESQIESNIVERTEGIVGASADIDSFPFVTRLLATEEVRRLDVTIDRATDQRLEAATVTFSLEGLVIDRSALVGGEIEIRSADRGSVVLEITEQDLSEAVGIQIELEPGEATATVAGLSVTVAIEATDGQLTIGGGQVSVSVPLPVRWLPCVPEVAIETGRLLASCVFEPVPEELLRAVDPDP